MSPRTLYSVNEKKRTKNINKVHTSSITFAIFAQKEFENPVRVIFHHYICVYGDNEYNNNLIK